MYNAINFGFPIYLVLFELILRSFITTDMSSFVGPALASAGMGMLIGLLKPKKVEIDDAMKKAIEAKGRTLVVRNPNDEKVINISWGIILIQLLAWYYVCMLSIKESDTLLFNFLPMTILIGGICYFSSIGLSIYKDKA